MTSSAQRVAEPLSDKPCCPCDEHGHSCTSRLSFVLYYNKRAVTIRSTPPGSFADKRFVQLHKYTVYHYYHGVEATPPASATVRDDLYHLKRLGLVDSKGHGRGAVWFLGGGQKNKLVNKLAIEVRTTMTKKPHYLGHRERLRERFQKAGTAGLHDYELLELLLTYAIPRKELKPLAKELIEHFGGFSGVLDANQQELEAFPGLGPTSATLIRLIKELCGAYLAEKIKRKDVLSSPQAVVDFARVKLSGLPHEAFMVIYLNAKNEVIDYEIIHEGTVDRAIVYPRRIIEAALVHHAAGLILVHNHPSGHPQPSEDDKRLTRAIVEAARTVEIRVVDHLIVGKGGYFSFREAQFL